MNHTGVLLVTFYTLARLILETLHKRLRNIHIYDGMVANVLGDGALKKDNSSALDLPTILTELSASSGAII